MNPLLFFNNQQINQPYDFTTLDITNGVAIIRWDYSVHALQSIVYCLVERQSFFVGSSTWSSSFYEQFLSLINAHGCPNGACLIATSGTAGAPNYVCNPLLIYFYRLNVPFQTCQWLMTPNLLWHYHPWQWVAS